MRRRRINREMVVRSLARKQERFEYGGRGLSIRCAPDSEVGRRFSAGWRLAVECLKSRSKPQGGPGAGSVLGFRPEPSPAFTRLEWVGQSEVLKGRLGGYTRWARTSDRTAATAPAREAASEALAARFEREVDPDGTLPGPERAVRAEAARRAHYARLALIRHTNTSGKKSTGHPLRYEA